MNTEKIMGCIFGLVLIAISGNALYWLFISQMWLETKGKVMNTKVENGSEEGYTNTIDYEFEVDGFIYRSQKLLPYGGKIDFYSSPEKARQSLPKDSAGIIVYFNPHNPNQCCLERRGHIRFSALWIIGFILVLKSLI